MDINAIKKKLNALQNTGNSSDRKNNFWKPSLGKQVIRIVPSKFNKANPFSEVYFHYDIAKWPMIALTNFNEKDPIVEFVEQLRSTSDKESWRLARKLEPKMRIYVPVIVRGEESEGVKLWGFGKEIYMELLSMAEDEDIGDYTDLMVGRDITLTTVGPEVTGTKYNKTTIRARTAATPLMEDAAKVKEVLENQPNPLDPFTRKEYDEMKKILQEWISPEDEEDVEDSIVSEPASTFDGDSSKTEAPWKGKSKPFSLEAQAKSTTTKADKFDSLFNDDDDLHF